MMLHMERQLQMDDADADDDDEDWEDMMIWRGYVFIIGIEETTKLTLLHRQSLLLVTRFTSKPKFSGY